MRFWIAVLMLCLTGLFATANADVTIRVGHGRRPVEVRQSPYQIVGQILSDNLPGSHEPEIYELRRVAGQRGIRPVPTDGYVEFSSGKDRARRFVIDPKGLIGDLYLVSEIDPAYKQAVNRKTFRFSVPNRPGGPIIERYFLVLEYEGEMQRRIFDFTVTNSAPPDLGGTRW